MAQKSVEQRRQERLIILFSLLVGLISIVVTIYFSSHFSKSAEEIDDSYNNVTFTDAVLVCRDRTRAQYRASLLDLTLDDHSSRFESRGNVYKIFYTAKIKDKESDAGEGELFINCYVSGSRGSVTTFETNEKKESSIEAIRKNDGGFFGFPK